MKRQFPNRPRRKIYGLEWRILKQTPLAFVLSGIVIYLTTKIAHWLIEPPSAAEALKQTEFINIIAISALITIWTAIFTVAIGAFVVYVMKGPAYTADSLELIDSDRPLETPKTNKADNSDQSI